MVATGTSRCHAQHGINDGSCLYPSIHRKMRAEPERHLVTQAAAYLHAGIAIGRVQEFRKGNKLVPKSSQETSYKQWSDKTLLN
jgi:hypothetical protein